MYKTPEGPTRLPHHVAVYVPSTVNVNSVADRWTIEAQLNLVKHEFDREFGAHTLLPGVGGWTDSKGNLVEEPVAIVQSYADSLDERRVALVVDLARQVKQAMSQEAVAIVVDGTMYLV